MSVFLDLLELDSTDANSIVTSLLKCLRNNGFTDDILHERWVGFACDGASVMLGRQAGVYAQLHAIFPQLIGWHCFNHRLELSVHDAVKACTEVNHFKIFIQKLYTIYSMSPKNRRKLDVCAAELGVQLLKIGRVLDVRWVASSFRTVLAVWSSYPALHKHFSDAASDAKLNGKEKAEFKGLASKLSSNVTLMNIAVMCDALEELSELSLSLQAESISIQKAHRLIARQLEVFTARKSDGGDRYEMASKAVAEGSFKGVPVVVSNSKADRLINKSQFYQALVDSLSRRLMPESEREIVDCLNVLLPNPWPADLSAEYGKLQLKQACMKFRVSYSGQLKQEYRDLKDIKDMSVIGSELQKLVNAVHTLPVSTAECERGFSQMNLICTPTRSLLTVPHMSALMFINTSGPPLAEWCPLAYVKSWLGKGRHAATDLGKTRGKQTLKISAGRKALWKCLV